MRDDIRAIIVGAAFAGLGAALGNMLAAVLIGGAVAGLVVSAARLVDAPGKTSGS